MAAKRRRLDMESLALEESVQKRIAASYLINFREYSPAEAAAATGYTRASDAALSKGWPRIDVPQSRTAFSLKR